MFRPKDFILVPDWCVVNTSGCIYDSFHLLVIYCFTSHLQVWCTHQHHHHFNFPFYRNWWKVWTAPSQQHRVDSTFHTYPYRVLLFAVCRSWLVTVVSRAILHFRPSFLVTRSFSGPQRTTWMFNLFCHHRDSIKNLLEGEKVNWLYVLSNMFNCPSQPTDLLTSVT